MQFRKSPRSQGLSDNSRSRGFQKNGPQIILILLGVSQKKRTILGYRPIYLWNPPRSSSFSPWFFPASFPFQEHQTAHLRPRESLDRAMHLQLYDLPALRDPVTGTEGAGTLGTLDPGGSVPSNSWAFGHLKSHESLRWCDQGIWEILFIFWMVFSEIYIFITFVIVSCCCLMRLDSFSAQVLSNKTLPYGIMKM